MTTASRSTLSGVVVLERADRPCVSICGSLLADFGATVLHVAGAGRDIDLSASALARMQHRAVSGKTRITAVDDATSWHRLVERADVVLLAPQESDEHDWLARESRRRIVCAFSSFGTDAPAGTQHAGETALQAAGGMMAATGAQGGGPERANVPIIETFAGLNAATAILAALRTGKPTFLDIAAFDGAVALLSTFVSTIVAGRGDGYRIGCGHHLCCPWNVYRAADGWVQLCSATDVHWRSIARLLARDDLGDDPRFAKSKDRLQNAAMVDQIIGGWIAERSADEAVRLLLSSGLPAGWVRTVPQIVSDPDLRARGMVIDGGPPDSSKPHVGSFVSASAGEARSEQSSAADVDEILAALGQRTIHSGRTASADAAPLKGVRVVEIGAYTAGPLAGRYLADLGAEVIKIESPGGEVSRGWLPQFGEHSGYFVNCNLGKTSVVLDLKSPADHARFVDLVRTADVLLESLRPGALNKLGLGPDKLLQVCPSLIYCSLSGFGRAAGPRPALDSVVQAEVGMMWLVGEGDRPQRVGVSIADQAAAHAGPLLILAALRRREASGAGGLIDLSMQDVLAWATGPAWPDGGAALTPWTVLEAADGWIIARGDSPAEPIVAKAKSLTRNAAVAHLQQNDIEAVGILEMGEALVHEAIRRRNLVQFVEVEGGAKLPILSSPHRIGLPASLERLPSPAGADTARILGQLSAR
ncbi:MAG: CoA transferase [Rhizobiales bacterium]|nr:CoA transferase [Hyphomicrobiales bacterium]